MTNNEKLKNWMDAIPYGQYRLVRERIISDCKITPFIYGNWRNGTCTIPLLAQEKIEKIADELASQGIAYQLLFHSEETNVD